MNDLFLRALRLEKVERPPVWLFRQAGRYMPEYQEIRKKYSLWQLFHDPQLAAEITSLAVNTLNVDAAILFSDILVLAEAFDRKIVFPEQGGPYIDPLLSSVEEVENLRQKPVQSSLSYVQQSIYQIKQKIDVPLIGFSAAPFTLASYWIDGGSRHQFTKTKYWIQNHKKHFHLLLEKISHACIDYLRMQVEAGADALQLFDSWANILPRDEFSEYALFYWNKIIRAVEDLHIPLMVFCRGSSSYVEEISAIGPSCISFDEAVPLAELRKKTPSSIAIQGNLSPEFLLHASVREVEQTTRNMINSIRNERGVIMNLGHGVLPKTPMANVHAFIHAVKTR